MYCTQSPKCWPRIGFYSMAEVNWQFATHRSINLTVLSQVSQQSKKSKKYFLLPDLLSAVFVSWTSSCGIRKAPELTEDKCWKSSQEQIRTGQAAFSPPSSSKLLAQLISWSHTQRILSSFHFSGWEIWIKSLIYLPLKTNPPINFHNNCILLLI